MAPQRIAGLLITAVIGLSACGGDAPTAPTDSVTPTTLQVEPDAALAPGDPTGLVNLSVWPHEAGGQVSIELCVDPAGRPIAARLDASISCEAQDGRWTIARDVAGSVWLARTWPGWASVRFERAADQPPMLFRTTYEAPSGGVTRDVTGCAWLLAENRDVGVACRSDRHRDVLPSILPGGGAPMAE